MVAELRKIDRRSGPQLRAIESAVIHLERTRAWQRVHRLGQIAHFAGTYDKPQWAEQAGAELVDLAQKQLRMLQESGGNAG